MRRHERWKVPVINRSRSGFMIIIHFLCLCVCACVGLDPFFGGSPLKGFPHDATIFYGTTYNLTCTIDHSEETVGTTSSDIVFEGARNDISYNYEREIVDNSTVTFHVSNLEPGAHHLYCFLTTKLTKRIQGFMIYVGDLPAKVPFVNCTVPRWKNFTCEWTTPHNAIDTEYRATLHYPGRNARYGDPTPLDCHLWYSNNHTTNCYLSSEDHWLSYVQIAVFRVIGKNKLGTTVSNFTIDQFRNTIPPPPESLKSGPNKTVNSFTISFNVTRDSMVFPPGYKVDIEYCSNLNKSWTTINTSSVLIRFPTLQTFTYELKNLPYSGTLYDVRVYLKAPNSPYRSASANGIFSTLSARPSSPPLTTPGIFEFHHKSELTVYWQELDGTLTNSPNVSYQVQCFAENGCSRNLTHTPDTFAKFEKPHDQEYTFQIYSVNEIGFSVNYSEVHVPRFQTVPPVSPVVLDFNNGTYTVSWNQEDPSSVYYTIFYCQENRKENNPGFCQSPLRWEIVKGHNKTIDVPQKVPYIFGVSAQNAANKSSGIAWATCSVRHKTGDHTVRTFLTSEIHSRYVLLEWRLGCLAKNQLNGFIITFCKAYNSGSANGTTCTGEHKGERKIYDTAQTKYNLTELLPYSTYKVDIAIMLEGTGKIGHQRSIDLTTSEDVPDPPTELTATHVNHNSVFLEWKPPKYANGVLQNYVLTSECAFAAPQKINIDTRNSSVTHKNITGLLSSTEYNFTLEVCHTVPPCSKTTGTRVKTSVYYPEKMNGLTVTVLNQTTARLSWRRPLGLESSICAYEVQLEKLSVTRRQKFQCTLNASDIDIGELCSDTDGQINYSIRAMNVNSTVNYVGNFSVPQPLPCVVVSHTYLYVIILLVCFGCLLMCLGASISYLINKKYIKCEPFKPSVSIVMPGGLTTSEVWPPGRTLEEPIPLTQLPNEKTPLQNVKEEELEFMESAVISWGVPMRQDSQTDDNERSEDYCSDLAVAQDDSDYTFAVETVKNQASGYVMCGANGGLTSPYISLPSRDTRVQKSVGSDIQSSVAESPYVTSLPPLKLNDPVLSKPTPLPSVVESSFSTTDHSETVNGSQEQIEDVLPGTLETYELDEDEMAELADALNEIVPPPQISGYVPHSSFATVK